MSEGGKEKKQLLSFFILLICFLEENLLLWKISAVKSKKDAKVIQLGLMAFVLIVNQAPLLCDVR